MAFGDQLVGSSSAAQTVTLSNTGTAPLEVLTIAAASAPFAVAGGSCGTTPFNLAAGGDCTITYTFSPTVTGAATQSLAVTSDALSSPDSIDLSGNGIQPALLIAPSPLDFGDVEVGSSSAEQLVTLTNTGTAVLTISAVDAASGVFATTASGSCGAVPITIAVGADCTISYTFSPIAVGPEAQSLAVTSDAPSSPDSIDLSGNGIQGTLVINPGLLDFGDQLVGTTSISQVVTFENTGTGSIEISAIDNVVAPFATTGGTCGVTPINIGPAGSCTIEYTFNPAVSGISIQSLMVISNSATSPDTIELEGNGVEAILEITPADLDFGSVILSQVSGLQTVTLMSTGSTPVNVTALESPGAAFLLESGTCSAAPFTLPAGTSCTLDYSFSPTTVGTITNVISVTSNNNGSANSFILRGSGRLPALFVDPDPIRFLFTFVADINGPQTVNVSNLDTDAITLGNLAIPGGFDSQFVIDIDNCSGTTLLPNDSCSFDISFVPTQIGVSLTDVITIQGLGVTFTLADLIASAGNGEVIFLDGFE